MKISTSQKLAALYSIFAASLVAANLLGGKITSIFGISVSVGIFAYPITFLITDAIEEIFGKEPVERLVKGSIVALVLVLGITALSVAVPPAERYQNNSAFTDVFSSSIRMIIASIAAFFLSQTHDIWAFNFWKEKTKGKFLWLRNNLSTIASQLIDTSVFMFLAFWKMAPKFDATYIVSLIIPYWIFKVIFALADTPFVYALVWWLKEKNSAPYEIPKI